MVSGKITCQQLGDAVQAYCDGKYDDTAALALEVLGMYLRENPVENFDLNAPVHPSNVEMAVKSLNHWKQAKLSPGDGFDQAHRCDMLHTGYLMAHFYLRHTQEYKHLLTEVKVNLEEIAEQVNEADALNYIRNQPPLLYLGQSWNHGLWRSYYARIAKNPNVQPNEYPLIGETE